jgi:hypothetical protein
LWADSLNKELATMSPGQNLWQRLTGRNAGDATAEPTDALDSLMPVMAATESDRRRAERHSFPAMQRIAPCGKNGALSVEEDFQLVRCHDLSTSGISFYWPTSPKFDHVIVALASQKGTTKVLAHVVFCGKQPGEPGEYLIGCRFLRRLPR